MKQIRCLVLVVLIGFLASSLLCVAEESPKPVASPLAPLAFFTVHEWDAKLPDSPDGKKMSIHARFTWSENKQAIRISNYFVIDGQQTPYIDGIYAWNPEKRAIIFVYSDAKAASMKGQSASRTESSCTNSRRLIPTGRSSFCWRASLHTAPIVGTTPSSPARTARLHPWCRSNT
jgi:dipeptidyl aminopeptidase/acylaminoacyl peptidase